MQQLKNGIATVMVTDLCNSAGLRGWTFAALPKEISLVTGNAYKETAAKSEKFSM